MQTRRSMKNHLIEGDPINSGVIARVPFDTVIQTYIIYWGLLPINMKSIGQIEEDLADKTEPMLGFRPSSKIKRGPIGIVISIICVVVVLLELNRSGVI